MSEEFEAVEVPYPDITRRAIEETHHPLAQLRFSVPVSRSWKLRTPNSSGNWLPSSAGMTTL